jgi:hypothetical protein
VRNQKRVSNVQNGFDRRSNFRKRYNIPCCQKHTHAPAVEQINCKKCAPGYRSRVFSWHVTHATQKAGRRRRRKKVLVQGKHTTHTNSIIGCLAAAAASGACKFRANASMQISVCKTSSIKAAEDLRDWIRNRCRRRRRERSLQAARAAKLLRAHSQPLNTPSKTQLRYGPQPARLFDKTQSTNIQSTFFCVCGLEMRFATSINYLPCISHKYPEFSG